MNMSFCPTCGKETGHQRKLGFGTLFAVLITFGFWLLALPLYPKRCNICGARAPLGDPRFSRKALPPLPHSEISLDNETKKCPACAESIKFEALKCRFCGHSFDPEAVNQAITQRRQLLEEMAAQGQKQCPRCRQWDVYRATIEDRGQGDWCPHCQISLQKLATLKK